MSSGEEASREAPREISSREYGYWQKTREIVDQLIDIILNYRQSGHPGGSRSKVHAFLALLLSGTMRWDIRDPGARFADRFILSAGHTVPLVYSTLAVLNEAMRQHHSRTNDERFRLPQEAQPLYWEDLLGFRHRGGLSGHAEMSGKTLFLKFNTGPSGHGSVAAVGEALALKRAGAGEVKVFALEGEGGLTPGANYEAMNSAWGLALDNLFFLVDWNDYGIDEHPVSSAVHGTPADWFSAHGWRTFGTMDGSVWESIVGTLRDAVSSLNPDRAPTMIWFRTRKGRSYLKYDHESHGTPHALNCERFWETKRAFAEAYNVRYAGYGVCSEMPSEMLRREFRTNLEATIDVLRRDNELVGYLAERLVAIGDRVPHKISSFHLARGNPFLDEQLYDAKQYPADLYLPPGERAANRAALAKWGAWVNALGRERYGRPLVLACSADLAESTNIAGFGKGYRDVPGYGWYERFGGPEGALLPQEITEFANAGIVSGVAAVNFSTDLAGSFEGFWGACSTYGAFSYLKYGMFRLFSQMAQDSDWRLGKVLWIVGHSGPETADDSRTHFGVFSPGVTRLFPRGHIVNLHPWEHNEVPVMLAAALKLSVPLVALHLTRPAIEIPDRARLGIPSHHDAARGAYVLKDYTSEVDRRGTVIVQGTSAVSSVLDVLRTIRARELNVKIICAVSWELFAQQPKMYRDAVLSSVDRANSMVVATQAAAVIEDWIFNEECRRYSIVPDWDDRWRTGGTLEEVLDEAHLSPQWVMAGIERFAEESEARLARLTEALRGVIV